MMTAGMEHIATGKPVYVLCARKEHDDWMKHHFPEAVAAGVKFETPNTMSQKPIDWRNPLHFPEMHPTCGVFYDHHTIESHLGEAIRLMRKYDEPKGE